MNLKVYVSLVRAQPLSLVGIIVILSLAVIGLLAPMLAPPTSEDPYVCPYSGHPGGIYYPAPTFPSSEHPFGTLQGYDLYYGCIWGIRMAFYMSILTTLVAVVIGLGIGSIAGYFEGVVDEVLMRFTDVFFALPGLVYVLLVVTALPLKWELSLGLLNFTITLSSIDRIILSLAVIVWPFYARLVRSEIKKVKQQDFVEAAEAIGCSSMRVLMKHVLPNSMTPILALAFLNMGGVLLAASTVSFLGFGPEVGYAEWGTIIAGSRSYLVLGSEVTSQFVLLPFIPAAFLSTFIFGWSVLGDTLMYMMDPIVRRRLYF